MGTKGRKNWVVRNAATAARRPSILLEYLAYQLNRAAHGGTAVRTFSNGIKISAFTGFGEYHSCAEAISKSESQFLETYPFGGGDLLDIGANLGVVAASLCRRFPNRRLHAFEPNPATHAALVKNLARNGCKLAEAYQLAVADHDGEVRFAADDASRATNHIAAASDPNAKPVKCVTVDSFVASNSLAKIALMKVDVEGYEKLVFDGARESLVAGRIAAVYFEVCPVLAARAGYGPADAAQLLASAGYRLFTLSSRGELLPADIGLIGGVQLANWIALKD